MRLWTLLVLCVLPHIGAAQTAEEDYLPRCSSGPFDLCGYVERDTRSDLIAPRFERAFIFSEGLAAVRVEGLFGYIDTNGEIVIAPAFDLAGPFQHGLAEVLVGGQIGIIDQSGEIIVAPQFRRAMPLTDTVLIASEGDWRSSHYQGMERLDAFGALSRGGRAGLYHIEDGWIIEPIYTFRSFGVDGLVWATSEHYSRGPFGLIRSDGTWQVEPSYTHVQGLHDGRAVVRGPSDAVFINDNGRRFDASGAVDESGTLVIPLEWEWLGYWQGGYGSARQGGFDGATGLVTRDGTLLFGRYFDDIERLGDGLFRVREDGARHVLNLDGEVVPDPRDGEIVRACPDGLTLAWRGEGYEYTHPALAGPIV